LKKLLDRLFNKRIKRLLDGQECVIVAGDRGTGKSALFCLSEGLYQHTVSNYPYDHARALKPIIGPRGTVHFDKAQLYDLDLRKTCVLIDEARTVYPARSYAKWSQDDDEFFNFLRKRGASVWLATQAYDCVDLNVKRSAGLCVFLTPTMIRGLSRCEITRTTLAKVADKNTELVGRGIKRGLRKVNWDICEQLVTDKAFFYHKAYWGKYDTLYAHDKPRKSIETLPFWSEVLEAMEKAEKP
jgi:energy-coupling factor transporter ATP-binding protein EcfA2